MSPTLKLKPLMCVTGALWLYAVPVAAQQQISSVDSGDATAASISNNGSRVAYLSNGTPLNSPANTGNVAQLFIVDTDGSDTAQLTNAETDIREPHLSGNGQQVAFISSADLTGSNGDGSDELFLVSINTSSIVQVTDNNGAGGLQSPSLSANGNRIAFSANADLAGPSGQNGDGSQEVFVVNSDGSGLVQISDGPIGTASQTPSLSSDGRQIVFSSNANLVDNNDDGNNEIFIATLDDSSGGSVTLQQLTDTGVGQSLRPSIADNGQIAFESNADLTGNNPNGNVQVFLMNSSGASITQLSSDNSNGNNTNGNSQFAEISADGSRIAFQSNASLLDTQNSDGSTEIYVVDSSGNNLQQLSNSSADATQPTISANGQRVAFQSNADLSGNNPQGNVQIFVNDPTNDGTGGPGDISDDSFLCDFASGCSFCDDDGDDTRDSTTPTPQGDQTNRALRGFDPTLSLLMLIGLAGVGRRKR